MAITNSLITTGDAQSVYVSDGDNDITTMYLCNTDTTARTFDVYVVPSGNTLTTLSHRVYSGIQLQTGDTYVIESEKLILQDGDSIRANTDASNAISVTVSHIGI